MRTLLALTTVLLLVAPGCGDDTSNNPDLAAPDLSVAGDMSKKTCGSILVCVNGCLNNADPITCAKGCAQGLDATEAAKFGALFGCVSALCVNDGGGDFKQ